MFKLIIKYGSVKSRFKAFWDVFKPCFFVIWPVVVHILDYFIVALPFDFVFDICLAGSTFYFCIIAISEPHFRYTKIISVFFFDQFFL